MAAHQIVHGLALVHYRRRVREFGFTFLHGFVPTFYVDVTDIFMASRRARVVTAVAGTLVHLVLGSLWFLLAANAPLGSFTQAFAAASGMIQWQALVVALYPFCFIEMDGYHVLVDVLGVPTLKQEASSWVGAAVTGARPGASAGRSSCGAAYVVLSTALGRRVHRVQRLAHRSRRQLKWGAPKWPPMPPALRAPATASASV